MRFLVLGERIFFLSLFKSRECQLNFLIHLVATCFVLMDGWMTKQTTNRLYVDLLCSLDLILVTNRVMAMLEYTGNRGILHGSTPPPSDIPLRLETNFYAPDGKNHCIQVSVTSSLRCGAIWTSLTG